MCLSSGSYTQNLNAEINKEFCDHVTHIDAKGNEVVWIVEVVRNGLRQVEGQLDELKGRAGIPRSEDDPTSVLHHWDVCRQNHLSRKD